MPNTRPDVRCVGCDVGIYAFLVCRALSCKCRHGSGLVYATAEAPLYFLLERLEACGVVFDVLVGTLADSVHIQASRVTTGTHFGGFFGQKLLKGFVVFAGAA